ncbi:MAG: [FeFe] hydrogenase H-cluster maturation GTPase HydF, partial [Bacillota bacterium]|nr:[FeFe] hydrogenase H-cluster maturation GTPase HydF [Bacillota bacterium]
PVDSAAPKGRLILPQQQTIREILDNDAMAMMVKENALESSLSRLAQSPKLVVTDSQAFAQVAAIVPEDIPLTSFSILFARHKGRFAPLIQGVKAIDSLEDGAGVLIAEGCTHHRQCGDIGTVKLPNWLKKYTGKKLNCEFTSGLEFTDDLSCYDLVIHCGGCTLNRREMCYRIDSAIAAGVPVTNYGIAISHLTGILQRCLSVFDLPQ